MRVLTYGMPDAERVLLQPVGAHELGGLQEEAALLTGLTDKAFTLMTVEIKDWNNELSPWAAPPAFGKEGFGGGAVRTLQELMSLCEDADKHYYIGGYSLAGLFSLWAYCESDRFWGVAAASPSVWFPGFMDYMKRQEFRAGRICLSLGDREEKTKNPVMSTVGDNIRELYSQLVRQGIDCRMEWNEGNHFREPVLRTAKTFAALLND